MIQVGGPTLEMSSEAGQLDLAGNWVSSGWVDCFGLRRAAQRPT
jgi:hypothetical protein